MYFVVRQHSRAKMNRNVLAMPSQLIGSSSKTLTVCQHSLLISCFRRDQGYMRKFMSCANGLYATFLDRNGGDSWGQIYIFLYVCPYCTTVQEINAKSEESLISHFLLKMKKQLCRVLFQTLLIMRPVRMLV